MIHDFDYVRAETLDEALDLLGDPQVASRPLAGGTDLMLQMRRGQAAFDRVVDISRVPGLRGIDTGEAITIGAAEPLSDIMAHPVIQDQVPLLVEACRHVGGVQIRNVATLGGNVANAAACADLATVLVCLEAEALIATTDGERRCPVGEVMDGPCHLPDGGLIRAFTFAPPPDSRRTVFLRVGRRQAMAIARLSVAAAAGLAADGTVDYLRVVPGAVFQAPHRLLEVEAILLTQWPTEALIAQALDAVQETLVREADVIRWSAPYKEPALAALTERALRQVLREIP